MDDTLLPLEIDEHSSIGRLVMTRMHALLKSYDICPLLWIKAIKNVFYSLSSVGP